MSAPRVLAVYALAAAGFAALDLLWLGLVARSFYTGTMGDLMRPRPRWGAAVAFYAIYVAAVLFLATFPALEVGSPGRALVRGAVLGCAAYAAWDLTNLAVLQGFPARVVPVDLAWGTAVTAATAWMGYLAGRWLEV